MTSTDWHAYDVGQLAGIVNEDLTEGWNHVWAWTLATDMLNAARDQLEAARTSLAAVWTAEESPAAQEFFNFVDAVSESMAATAAAATANRTAMQQVLDSQAATQTAVNELHDSWQSWSRDAIDPADAQSVINDLNARAATHMAAADLVITDATQALVVPHTFDPGDFINRLRVVQGTDGTESGALPGRPGSTGVPRLPTGGSTPEVPGENSGGRTPVTNGGGNPPLGLSNPQPGETPPETGSVGTYPGPELVGAHSNQSSYRPGSPVSGTSIGRQPNEWWQAPPGSPGTVGSSPSGELGYVDGSPVPPLASSGTPGPPEAVHNQDLISPMMLGGAGWGSSRQSRRSSGAAPWEVPVGVPAILVPAIDNVVHDPGPGVIGIDL